MRKYLQNTSENDHIRSIFKLQNTSNARFGMTPKLSSQGVTNSFSSKFARMPECPWVLTQRTFDGMLD